jgi:signal recognition particle subunit SRP54
MFSDLSGKLGSGLSLLKGRGRLTSEDIEEFLAQTRRSLLEADVALSVVESFITQLGDKARDIAGSDSLNPAQAVLEATQTQLIQALGSQARTLQFAKSAPTVVMLLGLQGSGKTTLAAKLALHLQENGHTPLLVAADLQRPNAVEQLQTLAQQAGVSVFAPEPGNGVGDPVAVAKSGLERAKQQLHDVMIVDTAGRLALDDDLIDQASRIKRAVDPDETLLVVDSMIGQDAAVIGRNFQDKVGFDGLVLTKLDGDTRGGAALSLIGICESPILFASVGEKLTDLEVFYPDRMAGRILQLGDLATLTEQAAKVIDAKSADEQAAKLATGDFTLQDFLDQLVSIKKMGSLSSLVGMLPGSAKAKLDPSAIDEKELKRTEAIIRSMTPAERAEPRLLDGARRARIAQGAGVNVSEINALIKRFEQAKVLMNQAQPGIKGRATHKSKTSKSKPGSKGRSGNPAKRAAQDRQRAEQP